MKVTAGFAGAIAIVCCPVLVAAQDVDPQAEIDELRALIAELRSDYESRLNELEERLADAEAAAAGASQPQANVSSVTAGNAFNPRISLVLDGNFYHDSVDGAGTEFHEELSQPSQPAGEDHEHGAATENGFNLKTVELAFDTTVDPYFDASAFMTVDTSGSIDIEEAWFVTRSLPGGLRVKGGRMLSDIGYLNNKHEHQWDFADQNLAYLNLLGDHGLQDNGVQATWLPGLPFYLQLGGELFQGNQERVGALVEDPGVREQLSLDEPASGPRMWTAYAKYSPDLGYDNAMQLGAFYIRNRQHQEILSIDDADLGLQEPASTWGIDFIYRHDNAAAYGKGDWKIQGEYLRSVKDLSVRGQDLPPADADLTYTTDGAYLQGIYGFASRWQAGIRYDVVGMTNRADGPFSEEFGQSDRWSAVISWLPTEFSLFRLQYSHSELLVVDSERQSFDTIWLQFLMSLGSHGAHTF